MTLSELSSYRYIVSEIDRLTKTLIEMQSDRIGKSTGGEHISSGIGDNTAQTAARIVDLQNRLDCLMQRKNVLDGYIEGIERADIKYMLTAKFVEGLSYEEIAKEFGQRKIYIKPNTIQKKIARYIEK